MLVDKPRHGGNLLAFCQKVGCRPEQCLDLSAAISPWPWPVQPLPESVWQQLPGFSVLTKELSLAAAGYYHCAPENLLALPGTQFAIQSIPFLLQPDSGDSLAIPEIGYQEYAYCWSKTPVQTRTYRDMASLQKLAEDPDLRFVVVINPNNPSAEILPPGPLLSLARTMADRQGLLLVDEAFMDTTPDLSLASYAGTPGLLVLRSVGKFFGLPGLRLGFALGAEDLLSALEDSMGPWAVNGAAEYLGTLFLKDDSWIKQQRIRLLAESVKMCDRFKRSLPGFDWRATSLFLSARAPVAEVEQLANALAKYHILVRVFSLSEREALIRIGFADRAGCQRLISGLTNIGPGCVV